MASNNWYVITGGPSSGKTTLLHSLASAGHQTLEEAARLVIDTGIVAGKTIDEIRGDEEKFQYDVLEHKINQESKLSKDQLTFFDRGMHDTLAYLNHYGWKPSDRAHQALQNSTYRKVFLLEPLPTFAKDYARTEDGSFAKNIHTLLKEAYSQYGMDLISVPVLPVKERLDFILNNL